MKLRDYGIISETYLLHKMNAVNIDTGRQLFVDDALIETTDGVVRHWNKPTKIDEPLVRAFE